MIPFVQEIIEAVCNTETARRISNMKSGLNLFLELHVTALAVVPTGGAMGATP